MSRTKLENAGVDEFLRGHPSWQLDPSGSTLTRTYGFGAYADGVAFTMAVALAAERRDHHPDMLLGYRRVTVSWSTHDAGGITLLDCELAAHCDEIAQRFGPAP